MQSTRWRVDNELQAAAVYMSCQSLHHILEAVEELWPISPESSPVSICVKAKKTWLIWVPGMARLGLVLKNMGSELKWRFLKNLSLHLGIVSKLQLAHESSLVCQLGWKHFQKGIRFILGIVGDLQANGKVVVLISSFLLEDKQRAGFCA